MPHAVARPAGSPRVLVVTTQWPTPQHPHHVPFAVQQVESLRGAGIDVDVFAYLGRKRPGPARRARREIAGRIAAGGYDIVHSFWGSSGLLVGRPNVGHVVTFHGTDLEGIVDASGRHTASGRLLAAACRRVARRADEVIVVSERLASRLPRGVRPHVIEMPIDLTRFRPAPMAAARRELGLPEDRRLVLFCADPARPVKRFGLAREAVDLAAAHIDVDLVVAADVPHALVPVYMNACDVLLVTSSHEGGPIVVREALACDLPVVSVDVGDVRRWTAGLTGCVVCDDDSKHTIARALVGALSRTDEFRARDTVEGCDDAQATRRIAEVYQLARERAASRTRKAGA